MQSFSLPQIYRHLPPYWSVYIQATIWEMLSQVKLRMCNPVLPQWTVISIFPIEISIMEPISWTIKYKPTQGQFSSNPFPKESSILILESVTSKFTMETAIKHAPPVLDPQILNAPAVKVCSLISIMAFAQPVQLIFISTSLAFPVHRSAKVAQSSVELYNALPVKISMESHILLLKEVAQPISFQSPVFQEIQISMY